MQTEIEAKFLNVDHDEIREKLKTLGAKPSQPIRLMRRKNFDYPDGRLQRKGGWVRVRDEGNKITVSYKQLNNRSLDGTKEVSLVVDSFDESCLFLESIGLTSKSFQETKRESWLLDGAEIELDEWPWIPRFIEIEADDQTSLEHAAKRLELDIKQAVHGSVEVAYQDVYDVSEEEVDSWQRIVFEPVPDWLEAKRRK